MSELSHEKTVEFIDDVDKLQRAMDQVLAHWHDAGQSHWTGGSLRDPGEQNDAPPPRVRAAFDALRDARKHLSEASHQLALHAILGAK